MDKLTNDEGMDVTPRRGRTVALPGLGELVHADPGLRAWLRPRHLSGLNTEGLPGLAGRLARVGQSLPAFRQRDVRRLSRRRGSKERRSMSLRLL